MSLRDKQEIGELRRQIAQLEVALGPEALTVLHPLMRENDRLSHSLIVARTTIERLQAQLKHANAALEAATNAHAPPQPDHSLAVLQTTEGVSAATVHRGCCASPTAARSSWPRLARQSTQRASQRKYARRGLATALRSAWGLRRALADLRLDNPGADTA